MEEESRGEGCGGKEGERKGVVGKEREGCQCKQCGLDV